MHISTDRAQIYLRHKSSFVNKILNYNITLKKALEVNNNININNNINNSNKQIKFCVNVRTQIHVRSLRHLLPYTYL